MIAFLAGVSINANSRADAPIDHRIATRQGRSQALRKSPAQATAMLITAA
jgi:hypothetical protein